MNKIKIIISVIFFGMFIIYYGCSDNHSESTDHEDHDSKHQEKESVTIWTDELELFMEYDVLIKNNQSNFLIHLTDLKDFKPITEGNLILEFSGNNNSENFSITEPKRPGIYETNISIKQSGVYSLNMVLQNNSSERKIFISEINVYDSLITSGEEESHTATGISFLKEQQWIIDFKTEYPEMKTLQTSIKANGELVPKLQYYANVSSNIEGILNYNKNKRFPALGSLVKKGQVLAVVTPSVDANIGIQKVVNEFRTAESEYERAKDLYLNGSIPEKRYNEALLNFEEKKKVYESLVLSNNINYSDMYIKSPISGYIEKINIKLGDKVNYGQEMFTVINPNILILKVNVPSGQIGNTKDISDASFIIEGFSEEYRISSLGGRKTNTSAIIDEANRTIPLYFEFRNPGNQLKIGMFAQVYLKMNDENQYITVPKSAIIEEEGLKTLYIQQEGETFVKKIVKTGIEDGEYIQITEGLAETDRIVSIGAYQVKLASLTPGPLTGHGHNH